jgi:hypothetical protein
MFFKDQNLCSNLLQKGNQQHNRSPKLKIEPTINSNQLVAKCLDQFSLPFHYNSTEEYKKYLQKSVQNKFITIFSAITINSTSSKRKTISNTRATF